MRSPTPTYSGRFEEDTISVVTEFAYRLHPQPNTVFAGPFVFSPMLPRLFIAMEEWYHEGNPEEGSIDHERMDI